MYGYIFWVQSFLLQHWQMQTHTKLGTIYKPALKDVGQLLGSRLYIVPTTFGMPIVDSQQAF